MRFSIAALALIVISTLGVVTAQDDDYYGICTCFTPKYDASCCMLAKGYHMNDGNVCSTPDIKALLDAYETSARNLVVIPSASTAGKNLLIGPQRTLTAAARKMPKGLENWQLFQDNT
ncbi:hypothetical protein BGZ83_011380 [Gryganskiella cystojenkinii]|nr:hypothetical protein BGZ83_011380 [Gryganskiella cystojenkinii]